MVRNMVFDMGNVLLRYEPRKFLKKIFQQEEEIDILVKELFDGPEWPLADADAIDDDALIFSVSQRIPQFKKQVEKAVALWPELLEPMEGMKELLQELKARGLCLYLLSNAPSRFRQYISRYPILSLLDGGFFSGEFGIVKPTGGIYRLLCEKYDLVSEECFFVDDRPVNVEMARRLGWGGCVFTDCERLRRRLEQEGILEEKKRG